MVRSSLWGLRSGIAVLVASLAVLTLTACTGITTIDRPDGVGKYQVAFSIEPQRLNPPQQSTVNYELTDTSSGKAATNFAPVLGAAVHNVLISRDLTHFKHTYTNRVVLSGVSLPTYFPVRSKYYDYAIFQPAGDGTQVYAYTIQAADEGPAPALEDDTNRSKVNRQYGLQLDLVTGSQPLHAGRDEQLAVYVTERGVPVTGLWSFLDAPGYLWIIDQEGRQFSWEVGTSPSHTTTAAGTATPSPTVAASGTVTPTLSPPTLVPDLQNALATRTVQPAPTLAPVQQTAQASILGPQDVKPSTTYGPYVLFHHVFPAPGLYKMWFEFQYRGQVIQSDWAVQVEP